MLPEVGLEPTANGIKYAIHTKVGSGPEVLTAEQDQLLDPKGNPKKLN